MKRMALLSKRILSMGLSFALLAGMSVSNLSVSSTRGLDNVQAASAVTRTSIHDGTILHTFCWNFNTIREKMPEIAAAGYTAVQTSPINECLATHPGMALYGSTEDEGRWYYHYQPTDWKIGNYQLGSRDEFKAMCDEADKYGIGVIVDIAPNHTTPIFDQVSDDLKAAAGGEDELYHIGAKEGSMAYDNRISVTYDSMGNLPDVDTENPGFQSYFYEFLQDCITCGADGFRVDTAKHIALPDDGVAEEYAGQEDRNNFYPNMKTAIDEYASKAYADLFVYGEVLDGDASRVAAYQDMLGGTCASNYGGAIRNAVSSGNVSAKRISSYKISDDNSTGTTYVADSNKLVTWVESHDNYINDCSYNEVDDRAVILGWAIITARADGTPLFFSRPDGSSQENPWGNNRIGVAGSDIYKAPEVVAVNKFRLAMEGESENLRNPGNNSSILMIERGDKGVVIVNASENDLTLDSETGLLDGTYKDSVEGREGIFSVADGQITGTVPAKSVVVLDKPADGDYTTLFFHNTENWSVVNADVDGTVYNCENQGFSWWKAIVPAEEFKVKFKGDDGQESSELEISKKSGKYMTAVSNKLYFSKAEAEADLGIVTKSVYFLNTEEWTTVNAYAWTDAPNFKELFGGWPGKACAAEEGYWVRADVKLKGADSFNIIFNGEGGQTTNITINDDSNLYFVPEDKGGDGNYQVTSYKTMAEAEASTGIGADSITVHYYNAAGWKSVGVYTWGDIDLGSWPGQECEYEGDGWWKKTINASPSSNLNIIFNNMPTSDADKHQTDDMKADSLKKVYFVGANYKFSTREAAEEFTNDPSFRIEKNARPAVDPADENTVRTIGQEPELQENEARIYVRLEDNGFFEGANVYAWTEGVNTEYFGGWPGKSMTHIGNCWYSVNVPKDMLFTDEEDKDELEEEKEPDEEETLEAKEPLEEETKEYEENIEATESQNEQKDNEADSQTETTDESEETNLEGLDSEANTSDDTISEDTSLDESTSQEAPSEVSQENESVVDKINNAFARIFKCFVSTFKPLEVRAAENQLFKDGVHIIVNNPETGYQQDDVNAWFTTVRPSDEELKQEEPSVEPSEPGEPDEPGQTEEPSNPDPVNPEPTTPVDPEPTVPDEPSTPVDPGTPVEPEPSNPEPVNPEPTTPVNPEPTTPSEPSTPVNPEPATPDEPEKPSEEKPSEEKPQDNSEKQREEFRKAVIQVVKKVVTMIVKQIRRLFGFGW